MVLLVFSNLFRLQKDAPDPSSDRGRLVTCTVRSAPSAGRRATAAGSVRRLRLDPRPGLTPVICVPEEPLATATARQVLPASVPHADAAKNAARAAMLVAALTQDPPVPDPAVLLDATEDFLHQPYRAASMRGTAELVRVLRDAGIPAVVSGAGPAVLALIVPGASAGQAAVTAIAAELGHEWTVRALSVDRDGAAVRW